MSAESSSLDSWTLDSDGSRSLGDGRARAVESKCVLVGVEPVSSVEPSFSLLSSLHSAVLFIALSAWPPPPSAALGASQCARGECAGSGGSIWWTWTGLLLAGSDLTLERRVRFIV